MLILPLGLGRRIPRFPGLTLIMAAAFSFLSYVYFDKVQTISDERTQILKALKYSESLAKLAQESCVEKSFTKAQCEALVALIHLKSSELSGREIKDEVQKIVDRLEKRTNGSFEKELEAASNLAVELSQFSPASHAFSHLPSFNRTKTIFEQAEAKTQESVKKFHFLSESNLSVRSVLQAQFIHADWLHLIGNLLVFLILGIFLEQRISLVAFSLIYLIGGTVGLLAQIGLANKGAAFLLGASANISAVMGAFYVLYFRRPMYFLGSIVLYNRVFAAPVWLILPLVFVIADVTGAMASFTFSTSGVAHLAHLGGFLSGAGMAYVVSRIEPLPASCLYPDEAYLLNHLVSPRSEQLRWPVVHKALSYNPQNWDLLGRVFRHLVDHPNCLRTDEAQHFMRIHLPAWVALSLKRKDLSELGPILARWPISQPFAPLLKDMDQMSLLRLAGALRKIGAWYSALQIYDRHRLSYPNSRNDTQILQLTAEMLQALGKDEQALLGQYLDFAPQTTFRDIISSYTSYAFAGGSHV